MSITLETLRQNLSVDIGDYHAFTTTSAGAAGGTTVVCSSLIAETATDDTFISWWVLLTSGTYDGEERKVTDFTQSTGTLTVPAFSGQVANSVTFELHRYRPSLMKYHINRAMQLSYPYFIKRWDDRNLVSGNLLAGHFEAWTSSSAPNTWTVGSNCTGSEETTVVRFGSSAAKIIRASGTGAALYPTASYYPILLDQASGTLDFYGYCYCSAASTCRLELTPSSGTTGDGDYHTGVAGWEKLELEGYSVPSGITTLVPSLEVDTAATVYWDNVVLFGGPVYEYLLPLGITVVTAVYEGGNWDDFEYSDERRLFGWLTYERNGSNYLRFTKPPVPRRKLRIVGYGYFADLSSDSDTWAIEAKQADVINKGAASLLFRASAASAGNEDRARLLSDSERLMSEYKDGLRKNAMVVGTYQKNLYGDGG